jgi:hypothetical protein
MAAGRRPRGVQILSPRLDETRSPSPVSETGGFHAAGLLALAAGVIPCVPGFLATVGLVETLPFWTDLYHYAWFFSFGTSFLVYAGLMGRRPAGGWGPSADPNARAGAPGDSGVPGQWTPPPRREPGLAVTETTSR